MSLLTPVEVMGWGPDVAAAVERLEQAFFVVMFLALTQLFTLAFMAVALAFRR